MSSITKIEIQKNNSERVNIYIDGEYSLSCQLEAAYKYNLKEGSQADAVKLKKLVEDDNFLKCKGYALSIIERGPKSENELADKLLRKGYDGETASKVMDFMKEYGFVDDEKLARGYMGKMIKSQGTNKIKSFLYKKGIPEDIIKNSIFLIDEEMEEETAFNLAVKKYNILVKTEKDSKKLYKKIGEYLLRKGYSYDICKRVLNNIIKEWDNQDY